MAQYSATSFAQPLRRVLGTTLLGAGEVVHMPRPGDTRAATISVHMADPADAWLLAVAEAAGGVLVTFDRALAARGAHCLLAKRS